MRVSCHSCSCGGKTVHKVCLIREIDRIVGTKLLVVRAGRKWTLVDEACGEGNLADCLDVIRCVLVFRPGSSDISSWSMVGSTELNMMVRSKFHPIFNVHVPNDGAT